MDSSLPEVVFIHQHRYQRRYYLRLCAANRRRFSGQLRYYWRPRLISLTAPPLRPAEIDAITAFQLNKRRLRGQSAGPLTQKLLGLRARYEYRLWYRLLRQQQPARLAFWNGNNPGYRAARLAAVKLGIACAVFENGPLPNSTTCDANAVNASNSLPKDPGFYRQLAANQADAELQTLLNNQPAEAPQADLSPLPERFLFAAFQVHEDSQLLANSPQLADMAAFYQWLQQLTEACGIPVVIKEHPNCKQQYSHLHNQHRHIVFANQRSTADLIRRSQAVITVNSTVGLEAIILARPVITLGAAFYNLPGLTWPVDSPVQLSEAVARLPHWRYDEALRRGFLHYLRHHYLLAGSWRQASDEHCVAVGERLVASE